jgi:hypothetical protein
MATITEPACRRRRSAAPQALDGSQLRGLERGVERGRP